MGCKFIFGHNPTLIYGFLIFNHITESVQTLIQTHTHTYLYDMNAYTCMRTMSRYQYARCLPHKEYNSTHQIMK